MKVDLDFIEAKVRGEIIFSGISYLQDDLCVVLFYGISMFYIPVDPKQCWFYSIDTKTKYPTWLEYLKGENLS